MRPAFRRGYSLVMWSITFGALIAALFFIRPFVERALRVKIYATTDHFLWGSWGPDQKYEYKGENGIPKRHYFVKGDPTTHHLHIVEIDSEEWTKNITFRDALRKNKDLAKEYAELKLSLAEKFKYDRVAYTDGKTDFVNYILKLANSEIHFLLCPLLPAVW